MEKELDMRKFIITIWIDETHFVGEVVEAKYISEAMDKVTYDGVYLSKMGRVVKTEELPYVVEYKEPL